MYCMFFVCFYMCGRVSCSLLPFRNVASPVLYCLAALVHMCLWDGEGGGGRGGEVTMSVGDYVKDPYV